MSSKKWNTKVLFLITIELYLVHNELSRTKKLFVKTDNIKFYAISYQ